ncbi:hypothetical protein Tco_1576263 [Tanacetum coccineum]
MSNNSDDIQAADSDTCPLMLDRTDYESWSQRIRLYLNGEKKRYDADVRATNIVLQGLPKDIYKLINHNIEASRYLGQTSKWAFAGYELQKKDRESQLQWGAQNRAGNAMRVSRETVKDRMATFDEDVDNHQSRLSFDGITFFQQMKCDDF